MKRLLKIAALILGIVLLLILGVALYVNLSGIPSYEVEEITYELKMDSASIAEGARISSMLCAECHRGDDRKLSGKKIEDIDPVFGEIHSPNITNHPEHGIADYTPGELAYLLRTGIKRDGQYSPPYMVKLPLISDEDLNAIIAFLKSDHPQVQASDRESIPSKPSFMVKMLSRMVFKPYPYPSEPILPPDESNKLEFGKYLVTAKVGCFECHSADFKTNSQLEPETSVGFLAGGNKMLDLDGNLVLSPNITPHKETGIGSWTLEEFEKAVKWGQGRDGNPLNYPMPVYTVLTAEEIEAIWTYLQSVPAISNEVPQNG